MKNKSPRWIPFAWGIICFGFFLLITYKFGLNIFSIIIGAILLMSAVRGIKIAFRGSDNLVNEMTSKGAFSKEAKEEIDKL